VSKHNHGDPKLHDSRFKHFVAYNKQFARLGAGSRERANLCACGGKLGVIEIPGSDAVEQTSVNATIQALNGRGLRDEVRNL
jgi:hypothetical protein